MTNHSSEPLETDAASSVLGEPLIQLQRRIRDELRAAETDGILERPVLGAVVCIRALLEAGADPHAAKPPDPDRLEMNCQVAEELAGRGLKHTQGETDPEDEPQSVLELARRHSKKVYQTIRDHLGAERDAYDRADAVLAGLKTAATEPWFTELAGELAEKLGCKPRPWKRRAGVLHFSAKLNRLPQPIDQDEADVDDIAELVRLEPLQQWVRRRNASLIYVESPSDARNITRLLLAPMTDWIALLRMCGTNGANHGLRTRDIVTWLAKTGEQHPFELQGCGHDFVAIRFTEPIDDYEALHAAMESFCPGLSGDDPVEPAELKEFYANDRRCFFWWD